MSGLVADLLRARCRTAGSEPLITYYDLGSGERTELSAVTFANWVDKTSNLLVEEIGAEEGDRISLPLAVEAPGHWLTFVWELACWQAGTTVDLTDPAGEAAVITGPLFEPWVWRQVYACALDPMGFGFGEPLPAGVHDYAVEVRGQPDVYSGIAPAADALAWIDGARTLSHADLLKTDGSGSEGGRRLVRPSDPWTTCRDGLLVALVSGGSSVVVVGEVDSDALARVTTTERVDVFP